MTVAFTQDRVRCFVIPMVHYLSRSRYDELEEEDSEDQDYWINSTQIELFKRKGADSSLIAMLESALGENDDVEVMWERT